MEKANELMKNLLKEFISARAFKNVYKTLYIMTFIHQDKNVMMKERDQIGHKYLRNRFLKIKTDSSQILIRLSVILDCTVFCQVFLYIICASCICMIISV